MLLHGGDFLKCEARRIYHEGEFRHVDLPKVIAFYGDDEKNEKNQEAEDSQS